MMASLGGALSRLAEDLSPIAGMAGGLDRGGGFRGKNVWIAALKSRRLAEEFIHENNLLPVLFADRWDAAVAGWKSTVAVPTMEEAFTVFDEEIRRVDDDRRTSLVKLAVEWTDPAMAAEWANDLVKRANDYIRARTIHEAQRSITFLERQLSETSVVERRQIIYRLIESKVREIMMANSTDEFAFVVIDPAYAPEADSFVRPQRPAIVAIGVLVGFFAGLISVFFRVAVGQRGPGETGP